MRHSWGGRRLIVGTGEPAALPILSVAVPTAEALRVIGDVYAGDVYAVIHVTC